MARLYPPAAAAAQTACRPPHDPSPRTHPRKPFLPSALRRQRLPGAPAAQAPPHRGLRVPARRNGRAEPATCRRCCSHARQRRRPGPACLRGRPRAPRGQLLALAVLGPVPACMADRSLHRVQRRCQAWPIPRRSWASLEDQGKALRGRRLQAGRAGRNRWHLRQAGEAADGPGRKSGRWSPRPVGSPRSRQPHRQMRCIACSMTSTRRRPFPGRHRPCRAA